MSRALFNLNPRGEYRFQWRKNEYDEYIWYIRRGRPLSHSQVQALKDPTGLESWNGPGWKAHIDVVNSRNGSVFCTTERHYADMIRRMDELYRILKDNE